jgi:hypothetical protein
MVRIAARLAAIALLGAVALVLTPGLARSLGQPVKTKQIVSYKTPTCGCCAKWVDHLRANGFEVASHDLPDLSGIKAKYGVPPHLQSCHTAIVEGYVVEGHIPADVIEKLLKERPAVAGIAVPGMPMGSPGMEGPYQQKYDVLTFDRDGRTRVYASRP